MHMNWPLFPSFFAVWTKTLHLIVGSPFSVLSGVSVDSLEISLNSYFRVLGAVSKPVILLTIVREGDEPFRISLNIREFISCVFIIIIQ